MVIECAFGRLKSRFGTRKSEIDINTHHLPTYINTHQYTIHTSYHVIYACFVLHNFCEIENEKLSEESVHDAIQNDKMTNLSKLDMDTLKEIVIKLLERQL